MFSRFTPFRIYVITQKNI